MAAPTQILGIIFGQTRAEIGGIAIDASVNEDHTSELDITENAVEVGAKITDHAQIKPKVLTMQGVISDSPLFGVPFIANILALVNDISAFSGVSRSIDMYNQLVNLQENRSPFTVITGLKQYTNMLLQNLVVNRTASTGKAIHFTATLKQIRIAQSIVVNLPPTKAAASKIAQPTQDQGQNGTDTPQTPQPNDSGSFVFKILDKVVPSDQP